MKESWEDNRTPFTSYNKTLATPIRWGIARWGDLCETWRLDER
ncbi:hypothetical protein [Orenia metallireducens]|nr:hypothetical protein [Orenia metallireducens]